jgi:hypothetical protein
MHNVSKVTIILAKQAHIVRQPIIHRNLLPADNFTDSMIVFSNHCTLFSTSRTAYLTCENQSASQSFDASGDGSRRITSNVRLMSLNRGFTEEADRLLDYLVRPFYVRVVELR